MAFQLWAHVLQFYEGLCDRKGNEQKEELKKVISLVLDKCIEASYESKVDRFGSIVFEVFFSDE